MYVTEVIPHASDALPLLGALSKTASVDVAVVEEKTGAVIAPVLHPVILRVTAHVAIDGGASVVTVKVAEHVVVNGVPVLRHGEHTGAKPGRVVRGPGYRP